MEKSKEVPPPPPPPTGLPLLASESICVIFRVNGDSSPIGGVCCNLESDRTGVVELKSIFAAEEKKSPVIGGWRRSGVAEFPGVLKSSESVIFLEVGVEGRMSKSGLSAKRSSKR